MKRHLTIAAVVVLATAGFMVLARADEAAKKDAPAPSQVQKTDDAAKKAAPAGKKAEDGKAGKTAKREKSHAKSAPKPAEKTAKAPEKTAAGAKAAPQAKTPEKVAKKPEKKEPKTLKVVRLTIKGEMPEGPAQPGLFGELQPSLGKLIERLDEAAADKDVRGRLAADRGPGAGAGQDPRAARRPSPGCARPASRSTPS